MTAAASDAVPGADLCARFLLKRGTPRLPGFGIAEIVRRFDVNVANARGDVNVSLDKPIGRRDMAIAATRPHAFFVAAMRRVLEKGVVILQCHGMTADAKGIGRGCMVDRKTSHHRAGADYRSDE